MNLKAFAFSAVSVLVAFCFLADVAVYPLPPHYTALRPTSTAIAWSKEPVNSLARPMQGKEKTGFGRRLASVIMGLLARLEDPRIKIEENLERLKSPIPSVHRSAEEFLIKIAPRSIPALIKRLEGKDRDYYIEVLVKIGFDVIPYLMDTLDAIHREVFELMFRPAKKPMSSDKHRAELSDLDRRQRKFISVVVEALARIEDPRLDDLLIRSFEGQETGVGIGFAIKVAGKRKLSRAAYHLKQILSDGEFHESFRRDAAMALGRIKDPRAKDALIAAMKDKSAVIRSCAAWALGELRDLSAADVLKGALEDKNEETSRYAAEALNKMGWHPADINELVLYNVILGSNEKIAEKGEDAVPALEKLLSWTYAKYIQGWAYAEHIRENAIAVLSKMEDVSARIALIRCLGRGEPWLREEAARAIDNMRHPILGILGKVARCRLGYKLAPLTDRQIELIILCLRENRSFSLDYEPAKISLVGEDTYSPSYYVVTSPAIIKKIIVGEVVQHPESMADGGAQPSGEHIEVIETLLPQFKPDVPFWELDVSFFSIFYRGLGESFYIQDDITGILLKRSWMWNYLCGKRSIRNRALRRVKQVRAKMRVVMDTLRQDETLALLWRRSEVRRDRVPTLLGNVVSIYLMGSYPWVESPNDMDLVMVVEGEYDFTIRTYSGLDRSRYGKMLKAFGKKLKAFVPDLKVRVEIVGLETLRKAARGEDVSVAKLIRRKLIAYSGAIPMRGIDIFGLSKPPLESLAIMRDDLLKDVELANWDDIRDKPKKIEAKKRWRYQEARALEEWIRAKQKMAKGASAGGARIIEQVSFERNIHNIILSSA